MAAAMTQAEYDEALKTITEALDHWVKTAVSRKTLSLLQAERGHALGVLEKLRIFYDERTRF